MTALTIVPLAGLPEVHPGDDLVALVAEAADRTGAALADGDVVVVASKIVSKAEGAIVALPDGADPVAARRDLARREAVRVVAETDRVLVVETRHGLVCANAGVDASNAPSGTLLRLPDDPDASARALRAGLRARTGADVAVVVSDTFGRPWRTGQTDVAIGVAGLSPLRDERGDRDREGRLLEVTEAAVADEVAGAADLVRRKGDGTAVVVVRGLAWQAADDARARELVRPAGEDLFRRGAGGLAAALVAGDAVEAGQAAPTDGDLGRIAAAAAAAAGDGVEVVVDGRVSLLVRAHADAADGALATGVAAGVAVAVATDLGLSARWARVAADDDAEVVIYLAEPRRPGGR